MKNTIRNLVLGIMATALATTYFVGCSDKQDISSQPVDTTSISDTLTPGITETSDRFRYWYDNQATKEVQESSYSKALASGMQDSGKTFMNIPNLPIYARSDTEDEAILAGRNFLYLYNGKTSPEVMKYQIRSADGTRLYPLSIDKDDVQAFIEYLAEHNYSQPKTYEEYREGKYSQESIGVGIELYCNNISAQDMLIEESEVVVDISSLFEEFSLGAVYTSESSAEVYYYPAAGKITLNFGFDSVWNCTITSSDNDKVFSEISDKQIFIQDSHLYMNVNVIETVFGFAVERYPDVINIVTDIRDIITEDSALPEDYPAYIDPALAGTDPTKPMSDPDNKAIIDAYQQAVDEANKLLEEREQEVEEQIATPEQEEAYQKDIQDRQDAADNTAAYTTDGIPLTSNGDLAEPVKPTKNYKLPDGAQLEFTGDASTAMTTVLPEGCYWTPTYEYTNAYTDSAGNRWCNQVRESDPALDDNEGEGYFDPYGRYHPSQNEIDFAEALNAQIRDNWENCPTYSNDGMTDEEADALWELLNS